MYSHTLWINKANISHDLKALEAKGFQANYKAKALSGSRFTFELESGEPMPLEGTEGVETYKVYDLSKDSALGDNTPLCIYAEYQRC